MVVILLNPQFLFITNIKINKNATHQGLATDTDEQARHMLELLKKKSVLIKNFSHKLEKYLISGDKKTYRKKFKELLEKEEIKVHGKKIE